jgi:hypothetical protein
MRDIGIAGHVLGQFVRGIAGGLPARTPWRPAVLIANTDRPDSDSSGCQHVLADDDHGEQDQLEEGLGDPGHHAWGRLAPAGV